MGLRVDKGRARAIFKEALARALSSEPLPEEWLKDRKSVV